MNRYLLPLTLLSLALSRPLDAADRKDTLEVVGRGEVTTTADVVTLRLSVATRDTDLQEAKGRNDRITKQIYQLAESQHLRRPKLVDTALQVGLEHHARQGRGQLQQPAAPQGKASQPPVQLQQGRDQEDDEATEAPKPPELVAHLSRNIDVKFANLNQAVAFLAEAMTWESFRKTGELTAAPLSFGVTNPDAYVLEARRQAIASAQQKAQFLAELNGLKLGDATIITDEGTGGSPIPRPDGEGLDPFAASPRVLRPDMVGPPHGGWRMPGMVAPDGTMPPGIGADMPGGRAMPGAMPPHRFDLDHTPASQVTISASVRIVFTVHKAQ